MAIKLPKFRASDVRAEIQRIANEDTICVEYLDHSLERMTQRGITTSQVLKVLKGGEQIGDVLWCTEKEDGWRCKLKRICAGSQITVVAKLVERENSICLVVTTWES
jgi:hypothetical protein